MRLQLHAYCTACMLMYGMPKSMPAAEAALGGDGEEKKHALVAATYVYA